MACHMHAHTRTHTRTLTHITWQTDAVARGNTCCGMALRTRVFRSRNASELSRNAVSPSAAVCPVGGSAFRSCTRTNAHMHARTHAHTHTHTCADTLGMSVLVPRLHHHTGHACAELVRSGVLPMDLRHCALSCLARALSVSTSSPRCVGRSARTCLPCARLAGAPVRA